MQGPDEFAVRAAVNHTDTMAIAKNVATNGRVFSALVCAANIAAHDYRLAILAAAPIGLAAIGEQLPDGRARSAFSLATYGLAAVVAVLTLVVRG